MQNDRHDRHIMAIDCCEHVIATLESLSSTRITPYDSSNEPNLRDVGNTIDLIVIGVARYPVRRLFISQMRRVFPSTPILLLRREEAPDTNGGERVRGEFILSDAFTDRDCAIVKGIRDLLPFKPCKHIHKAHNYDVVREVLRIIADNYTDPRLDLERVATALPMSTSHLSRILNQQVGVSFRQLLRHVRIEEAKRILASRRYSVKEVAARVGFSDSHYFSRSFKEMTGLSASEYTSKDPFFD
jgi:AraC-like DNA-binding protein